MKSQFKVKFKYLTPTQDDFLYYLSERSSVVKSDNKYYYFSSDLGRILVRARRVYLSAIEIDTKFNVIDAGFDKKFFRATIETNDGVFDIELTRNEFLEAMSQDISEIDDYNLQENTINYYRYGDFTSTIDEYLSDLLLDETTLDDTVKKVYLYTFAYKTEKITPVILEKAKATA